MSLAFQTEDGTIYLENLYSVFNNQDCVLYKENFHEKIFHGFGSSRHFASFYFRDCPKGVAYIRVSRPN